MKEEFKTTAVGVMSGTSLDGLDLCLSEFRCDGVWRYEIKSTKCIVYTDELRESLGRSHQLPDKELQELHIRYGGWIGEQVKQFLSEENEHAELICSHGHTVKHEPEKGITVQIGCGQEIANSCGIQTVSDFRSLDVELGGQGAPLVPIGDKLLFSEYDGCLNLGGFSNISFEENGSRIAFDICPVNIVLNPLANKLGFPFDDGGRSARSGNLSYQLLEELNGLKVYHMFPRPSLAREWVEQEFLAVTERHDLSVEDVLRTITEHAALQIASVLNKSIVDGNVLVTGGGAYNQFLIERIESLTRAPIVIPDKELINFKEALVFGFLGILRYRNETNVLNSVTGAVKDSCSGKVHEPYTEH